METREFGSMATSTYSAYEETEYYKNMYLLQPNVRKRFP